jgi:hypothetical protein
MRPASAERQQAEECLEREGWISVKISEVHMALNSIEYHAVAKWCEDHLGPGRLEPGDNWLDGNDVWYSFDWYGFRRFHFKYSKHATMFTLRWT